MKTFNIHTRFILFVLTLAVGLPCATNFAYALEAVRAVPENELAYFYMRERPNYNGAQWIYDDRTHKIVGYAPWDPIQRRYTLFSLDGKYKGFIQATLGFDGIKYYRQAKEVRSNLQYGVPNEEPPYFREFLWYDSKNRYRGLFVKRLGGRPAAIRLPDGELGGEMLNYNKGDVRSVSPIYQPEIDPLRKMMEGVIVNPINPLINNQ